jgi:hypothetical protein
VNIAGTIAIMINDARAVVGTLRTAGSSNIADGWAFVQGTIATFVEIEQHDRDGLRRVYYATGQGIGAVGLSRNNNCRGMR